MVLKVAIKPVVFVLGLLALGCFFSSCERIPEWERQKGISKQVLEVRRHEELLRWVWSCRAQVSQERNQLEIEKIQDHLRSRGLSILDEDNPKVFVSTGFLWDGHGHLLVQLSKIDTLRDFECRFAKSSWMPAKLVGIDRALDLAILKVNPVVGIPSVNPWLERVEPLVLDESLFLVSSPLAGELQKLPISLQSISPHLASSIDNHLILFAPATSPTQQGGLIFDEQWRLVGLSLQSPSQVWGLGLDLGKLKETADLLIRKGEVKRPYLGFRLRHSVEVGFQILHVDVGSPAYLAGLRPNDSLLEWDRRPLTSPMDWVSPTISDIGRKVEFKFKRSAQEIQGSLEIGSRQ